MTDFTDLLARASRLVVPGERRLLGIAGAPASGKSTLAAALVSGLAPDAVLVPMDGFHLAEAELHRLGRDDRKGAPDTFDAAGYVALLRRLREQIDPVVYAPLFRRDVEEPIAGSIAVPRTVPLVITEGNYLLLDVQPWSAVRSLLDVAWFVDVDEGTRVQRLIARHLAFGRSPTTAAARAHGSDQLNADLVATTSSRADLVVRV
jgi:pantothenate kinase